MNPDYILSKTVHNLDQLLADPHRLLPVIVVVAEGYMGTQEMDTVSLGEIYFIHRVIRPEPEVGDSLRYYVANAICSGSQVEAEAFLIPTHAKVKVTLASGFPRKSPNQWEDFLHKCSLVAGAGTTAWLRDFGSTYKIKLPPPRKARRPSESIYQNVEVEAAENLYMVLLRNRETIDNVAKSDEGLYEIVQRQADGPLVTDPTPAIQRSRSEGAKTRKPPPGGIALPLAPGPNALKPAAGPMSPGSRPPPSLSRSALGSRPLPAPPPPFVTSPINKDTPPIDATPVQKGVSGKIKQFDSKSFKNPSYETPLTKQAQNVPRMQVKPVVAAKPSTVKFDELRQVPGKLEGLSSSQVVQVLRLLGLGRHAPQFLADHVDGSLLLSLDGAILKDRFQFDSFEAIKLVKFINGWRPTQ